MATKPSAAAKTAKTNQPKPAPKAASNAVAIVKAKEHLPAELKAQMDAEVAALQKRISAPSGDRIQITQAKTFKLPNGLEVDELEGIVVDFVAANYYYDVPFDRQNITPPKCFAIGLEPASLVPSANSPDAQCESCGKCWANQFKSADNGRGKACANTRLLALLPLDADEETPLWVLKVSATGTKSFDGHVAAVAQSYGLPVRGVVTKITFSDETYASLRFSTVGGAGEDLFMLAQSKKEAALSRLQTEPDVTGGEAANDSKARPKAVPRKAAGRR